MTPPRKQPGQQRGPRRINGVMLDVRGGAVFLGETEKGIRGKVSRGLIPHRRLGGRIIFIKAELEQWLLTLPGVTLEEAVENLRVRGGS